MYDYIAYKLGKMYANNADGEEPELPDRYKCYSKEIIDQFHTILAEKYAEEKRMKEIEKQKKRQMNTKSNGSTREEEVVQAKVN